MLNGCFCDMSFDAFHVFGYVSVMMHPNSPFVCAHGAPEFSGKNFDF